MSNPYSCPALRLNLTDRINSIIAKYENSPPVCTAGCPTRSYGITPICTQLPQCCSPVQPFSGYASCIKQPRAICLSTSSSLTNRDNECYQQLFDASLATPGPNLQRYLSTKSICPSLKGRLKLYEKLPVTKCQPERFQCHSTEISSSCQCKKLGLARRAINVPYFAKPTRCCETPRLASELVLIDTNENLARAEAEDISHAGAFLGNPKIVGTKDYSAARDAAVCVITAGGRQRDHQEPAEILRTNLDIFKSIIPNLCKFAPNSILIIVTQPVDILSYVTMKLSGFPPNRVLGLGTFLDTCRFQYFIAEKLGISGNSVQALVIGGNNSTSVPVWSAVSVMGMHLKDINKEIGSKMDPEAWNEIHNKVVISEEEFIRKKGSSKWGVGICVAEIVDAIIRNTRICITVSTFVKGCKHGLEKDIFMSLPCIIGRNGVQSYIRHLYTQEEQELTTKSCKSIYESQRTILAELE